MVMPGTSGDHSSPTAMDVAPQAAPAASDGPGATLGTGKEPLTAEFFKNLIGKNTRIVTGRIDTLSVDLLSLARRVEDNTRSNNSNRAEISKQAGVINLQREVIERLGDRFGRLEAACAGRTNVGEVSQ